MLSDIDEDIMTVPLPSYAQVRVNLSRTREILLIYIHGAFDMGTRLSETWLQKSLGSYANLFDPTSPEKHERISQNSEISGGLLDITAPLMNPADFESTLRVNPEVHATFRSLGKVLSKPSDSESPSDSEKGSRDGDGAE